MAYNFYYTIPDIETHRKVQSKLFKEGYVWCQV